MQKRNLLLYNITQHSSQPPACDKAFVLNRSTDRPTHFREDEGDEWGEGAGGWLETYLRGNLFMLGV